MKRDSCDTSFLLTVHTRARIRHKQEVLSQLSRGPEKLIGADLFARAREIDENLCRAKRADERGSRLLASDSNLAARAREACGALATTSPEDAFDRVADYAVARAAQILTHGVTSVHCAHALAAAQLVHAEEPMLLAYVSNHLEHARLVVAYAGICGIRENVAWFALAKMLNPSRFAAGALSEFRPLGRRVDVDREIRLVETLYRRWLRRAAVAFMVAYWLLGDPPTSGESQNPTEWQDV